MLTCTHSPRQCTPRRTTRPGGPGPSDRIAIVAPNSAEAILLFLAAAHRHRGSADPSYKRTSSAFPRGHRGEGTHRPSGWRRRCTPGIACGSAAYRGDARSGRSSRLADRRPPVARSAEGEVPDDGDTALLLHTSGTTSRPKLVPLRQRNLSYSADNIARTYELTPDDVALCVMPLFHIHGLMASTMATFASGGTVVVPKGGFDAMAFWQAAEHHHATWYSAVPTIHQMLLLRHRGHRPAGARRLRFIRSSSSALPLRSCASSSCGSVRRSSRPMV